MTDYKQLYIGLLKKSDDDICAKCVNFHKCDGKKCGKYCAGDYGYIDGKRVNMVWSCKDFDYGTCPVLENTTCNGCFDNDYSGFVLKEE